MAKKIVVELEAEIAKTEANLLKIKKHIAEINKEAESTNDEVASLEGASVKGSTGLNKIKDSFNKIGVAIKAAGIGLVIATLAKIKDVLSQNQKFLDAFNVTMEAISIVTNDFVKLVLDNFDEVGKKMKSVFDDPKASMESFGQSFKDNVTDKFDSLVGRFTNAGAGFKKLFKGDFKGSMDSFGKSFKDVILSQIPFGESIKENANAVKDYANEAVETAINITELTKQ